MDHYNLDLRFKIIESFKVKSFTPGEVIFRKGDPSSIYYFILDGQIEAYNEERDGSSKLMGIVNTGKPLGEIGILRSQPRSLTCIAKTFGYFLILSSELFLNLLASHMVALLENKIKFIEHYFPNVKKLTTVQKQRIAYAMGTINMSRGQSVSVLGENLQALYFISEGECVVDLANQKKHMILKLAPGNLIGEECIFFSSSLKYNISVSSEYSQVYTLMKQDIYLLLPPETIENWKKNFRAKDHCRKQLINGMNTSAFTSNTMSRTETNFKQASFYASKRLDAIQKFNERTLNTVELGRSVSIEKTLKQFSPAAIMAQVKITVKKPKTSLKLKRYVSKNHLVL
jgi:CRP-like cAMP-binding protein